jgi:large subunit ribosomal protein L2
VRPAARPAARACLHAALCARSHAACSTLIGRSAPTARRSQDDKYALLKLPSSEIRKIPKDASATIGMLSNEQWRNVVLGKAGANRWIGRRPKVRGVAMNPVDHPMGGGEGRTSGGRPSSSPWGWYTKGIRTRRTGQFSSKLIVRRRNHEKLGLATVNRGSW